ncbi:uncharacterized protein isoform X2 [Rhodnius prolixus]|uniref:uncharacterized protein isoform X2 n=1 Tax=Rhodnius prolixus TaxID=13249 RepID=UPI003D18DF4F
MFFRRTLSVAGNPGGCNNTSGSEDDVRSTTASAEALAPQAVARAGTSIPARFHYLADQPLEITNSLKGYNYPRTRTDAIYKTETPQLPERPLLSWRVLRWAIIPVILLILLMATIYTIIWVSQDRTMEMLNKNISSIEEGLLFDLETHSSHTKSPDLISHEEPSLVPNIVNDLEDMKTGDDQEDEEFDNSTDVALGEEVSFIDRLISSFHENRPPISRSNSSDSSEDSLQPAEGLNIKHFTSLGETGYMRRVPNGHKYGEYQVSFPSVSKYLGMSTTALPVSPTLPSLQPKGAYHSTTPPLNQSDSNCHSPQLPMCRGVIPWDLTSIPSLPGISTMESLREAMPYFELILDSGCSQRARQFLCTLLEPECQPLGSSVTPPCRNTCKVVAEECSDFIINILDLSQIFKCDNYPDSEDECINLARGDQCFSKETSCGDGSCIPKRWKCNGVLDCKNGIDEVNCTTCNKYQYACESKDSCIPLEWRCDGNADCEDGSDEINCHQEEEMVMHSHASPCPAGELRCVDGRCITLQQICDGNKDCSDGADEANCRIQYKS